MANLRIHKFRFPESLNEWEKNPISDFENADELIDSLSDSEVNLILCGLSSKEDLIQIINFFQKKRNLNVMKSLSIVLVDFQNGGKLLEAAQRLSLDRFLKGNQYLKDEEETLSSLIEDILKNKDSISTSRTYEDLFSGGDKLVLRKNTRKRIYPVEEEASIHSDISPLDAMRETPKLIFRLYEGEKFIESKFLDYFDREVQLMTMTLPEDNNLTLEFKSSYLGEKKGLRLKADVVSIEEGEGEYHITLKIGSHLKEFEMMLKVFQKREQKINQFIKKVKGY